MQIQCSAASDQETTRLRMCAIRTIVPPLAREHADVISNSQDKLVGIDGPRQTQIMLDADRHGFVSLGELRKRQCRNHPRICTDEMAKQFMAALRQPKMEQICNIRDDEYLAEIKYSVDMQLRGKIDDSQWMPAAWVNTYLSAMTRNDRPLPGRCELNDYLHHEIIVWGPSADYPKWLEACFSGWDYMAHFRSSGK